MTMTTTDAVLAARAEDLLREDGIEPAAATYEQLAAAQREARGPIERERTYRPPAEATAEVAEQVLRERGFWPETVDGAAYQAALREAERRLGFSYTVPEEA